MQRVKGEQVHAFILPLPLQTILKHFKSKISKRRETEQKYEGMGLEIGEHPAPFVALAKSLHSIQQTTCIIPLCPPFLELLVAKRTEIIPICVETDSIVSDEYLVELHEVLQLGC